MNKVKSGCALGRNGSQLGFSCDDKDISADNFVAKREGYAKLNMHVVALSHGLSECARESMLMGSFPQVTILNAVDVNIFSPMPQEHARTILGLPLNRKIIVFCADLISRRRNKGCPSAFAGA